MRRRLLEKVLGPLSVALAVLLATVIIGRASRQEARAAISPATERMVELALGGLGSAGPGFKQGPSNCSSASASCSAASFTTTGAYTQSGSAVNTFTGHADFTGTNAGGFNIGFTGGTQGICMNGSGVAGCTLGLQSVSGTGTLTINSPTTAFSGTTAFTVAAPISSSVASGSNAFGAATNGARIDFGAGASDYASSDGTTVTFAGPVTSASSITATSFTASGASGVTTLAIFGPSASSVSIKGQQVDGASAVGASIGSFATYSTAGAKLLSVVNNATEKLAIDLNGVVKPVAGGGYNLAGVADVNTAPTISSGFGTSPSIVNSNGTAAFQINVGTGGTATSGVIGLPAATNGWVCVCQDITTPGANVTRMTANSTASCTVTNVAMSTGAATAWTASDKLWCVARGD